MLMSDREAQLAVKSAKESLQQTIESLSKVVVNQVPGTLDYNDTYRTTLSRLQYELLRIRNQLGS